MTIRGRGAMVWAAAVASGLSFGSALAQCGEWDASLAVPGLNGSIYCSATYDDGTGPALYIGGDFVAIDGTVAFGIAKSTDGRHWQKLGGGAYQFNQNPAWVYDMVPFDPDGPGPLRQVLVVGGYINEINGQFGDPASAPAKMLATWNGTTWSPLLNEFFPNPGNYHVNALAVYNDGTGEKLYVGGHFQFFDAASESTVSNVAVLDTETGELVALGGTGTTFDAFAGADDVHDLVVHNDGTGSKLYVFGGFDGIIGVEGTEVLASWDGSAWSPLGETGLPLNLSGQKNASSVISFDPDGPGGTPSKLLVFNNWDRRLYTWDGTAWVTTTIPGLPDYSSYRPLTQHNDGTGNAVFFIATYPFPNEIEFIPAIARLIRYNGTTFTEIGDDLDTGYCEFCFPDYLHGIVYMGVNTRTSPPSLLISGGSGTATVQTSGMMLYDFSIGNYAPISPAGGPIARYDRPNRRTTFAYINDIVKADLDGAGPQPESIVVTGDFTAMGSVPADKIAAHNGSAWSNVGRTGIPVNDLIPGGTRIGKLHTADGFPAGELFATTSTLYAPDEETAFYKAGVFKYNAGTWQALGALDTFVDNVSNLGWVGHLVTANFGAGVELYALGRFTHVNGVPASGFVKWTGSSWVQAAGGIQSGTGPASAVAFNDGNGDAIYISGNSMRIGTSTEFLTGIFKWNGSTWSNITGSTGGLTLTEFNGGLWGTSGGNIYQWTGSDWTLRTTATGDQTFIGVADNGDGDRFYYVTFDPAVQAWSLTLSTFDGTSWTQRPDMGSFTVEFPTKVVGTDARGEQELWFIANGRVMGVGGEANPSTLTTINAQQWSSIARWHCDAPACPADFNTSGSVTVQDIFDFLAAWFAGNQSADFNHVAGVTVQDIFDFLAAWFAGCN